MISWLTPPQISEIFADEIDSVDGKVADAFEDRTHLFTRAVLPPSIEVAPHDRLQGGVALRATDTDIFVHPYVFRIVCTNGAIMARATQTCHISRDDGVEHEGVLQTIVRDAIRRCCDRESFISSADQVRSAQESLADTAIALAALVSGHRSAISTPLLIEILHRFDRASDSSHYGLMNAVTSVARDTRDPATKWRLEELGGSIPAMILRSAPTPTRMRSRALSTVGVA